MSDRLGARFCERGEKSFVYDNVLASQATPGEAAHEFGGRGLAAGLGQTGGRSERAHHALRTYPAVAQGSEVEVLLALGKATSVRGNE